MNSTSFPESNYLLRAGNNPNTNPLRVALCTSDEPGLEKTLFYVSHFEMNEQEKEIYLLEMKKKFCEHGDFSIGQIDKIMKIVSENIPKIWYSAMGGMYPAIISTLPLWDFLKPNDDLARQWSKPNSFPGEN